MGLQWGRQPGWGHPLKLAVLLGAQVVHARDYPYIEAFVGVTRCNVNQRDKDNMTPLTIAIRASDLKLFHLFFACPRTDVNLPDATGWTPLMIACAQNDMEMVCTLGRWVGGVVGGWSGG